MNIFDMPFWAASPFPTKPVENSGGTPKKIGKSYEEDARLLGEECGRYKGRG